MFFHCFKYCRVFKFQNPCNVHPKDMCLPNYIVKQVVSCVECMFCDVSFRFSLPIYLLFMQHLNNLHCLPIRILFKQWGLHRFVCRHKFTNYAVLVFAYLFVKQLQKLCKTIFWYKHCLLIYKHTKFASERTTWQPYVGDCKFILSQCINPHLHSGCQWPTCGEQFDPHFSIAFKCPTCGGSKPPFQHKNQQQNWLFLK